MTSENDLLKGFGIANSYAPSVVNRPQQTNILGTQSSAMFNTVNIGDMISNEARDYLKNLKEEDLLAEIIFPDDLSADIAALFLNMIDATIALPSNDARFASS